jgi:hypothetical protein
LQFLPSRNDYGIRIDSYELFIDSGNDSLSPFRKISSYNTFQEFFTLEAVRDQLGSSGTIYRAKILAVNQEGLKSDFSNECLFALGSLPSKPALVMKNRLLSSGDSIYVYWSRITTDTLMVQGYKLYADTGRNDPLRLVYDGSHNP